MVFLWVKSVRVETAVMRRKVDRLGILRRDIFAGRKKLLKCSLIHSRFSFAIADRSKDGKRRGEIFFIFPIDG